MTRPLWTLAEIVAATGGRLDSARADAKWASEARPESAITGISIDTRTLEPGDLFVPLTDARDGHAFVTQAFAKGAITALVREGYDRSPGDGVLIRVDDPLRALERIGIAARARLSDTAWVIAVTGSAGKTGTKEMLRACLKVCASSPDKVHAPEKSFNNHWGVPLTLARMPADTEFAVFEIGMNHAGEIRPLTKMVHPHIAIVTNVLPVHVGNFPDGEIGVANAKAEIFEGLETGGTAIILRDSPHYQRLREAATSNWLRCPELWVICRTASMSSRILPTAG
jgi:UDP-N-acetylmuramoyl-tripeptide--D-alanyl-D-alanine ligase